MRPWRESGEVRATVLLAAADQGGSDSVGLLGPLVGAIPAVGLHLRLEGLADGLPLRVRLGPDEVDSGLGAHGDEDRAKPCLRDAVIGRVEQLSATEVVAEFLELADDLIAVALELLAQETPDVRS